MKLIEEWLKDFKKSKFLLLFAILSLCGCSLNPNYVNRDPNMYFYDTCYIKNPHGPYEGIRYRFFLPAVFIGEECAGAIQYYKRQDNIWVRSNLGRTSLFIKGNLLGTHDHYNMNIDTLYEWLTFEDKGTKEWEATRGTIMTFSLSRVERAGLQCLRRDRLKRYYRLNGKAPPRTKIYQSYTRNLGYYCWNNNDINHYLLVEAELLGGVEVPEYAQEKYIANYRSGRLQIEEADDEFSDMKLDMSVDLESEVLTPAFENLVVKPVGEEIKARMDKEWKSQCEARMESFHKDYIQSSTPGETLRRLFLKNCGYEIQ